MQIGENGSEKFEQFNFEQIFSEAETAAKTVLPQIEAAIGGIEQNSGNSEG